MLANNTANRTERDRQQEEDGEDAVAHQEIQEYEKDILHEAPKQCQFNQRKTAKLLDLNYDQLHVYLRKYDLKT